MDERKEFEEAFRNCRGKVYCMIGRYVSDVCTIEDLTQHTFLMAWINRHEFRHDSTYSTWLVSIAKNCTLNYLTCKRNKAKPSEYIDCFPGTTDIVTELISDEEVREISAAILDLPKDMRDCVLLWVICNYSYEDIAKKLKVPVGTVRSRIHRGRFALREALKKND